MIVDEMAIRIDLKVKMKYSKIQKLKLNYNETLQL